MIKLNVLSSKKLFPLAVLVAASALAGCGGDSSSGSESNTMSASNPMFSSSFYPAQECALPQELCGTWEGTDSETGAKQTLIDGRFFESTQETNENGSTTKTTWSSQFKHAGTIDVEGIKAYRVYGERVSFDFLLENVPFANISEEEKAELADGVKKGFESEQGLRCSDVRITERTMTAHCYQNFTEQDSPLKGLFTIEQGRLCSTGNGPQSGGVVNYPAKPDADHRNDCMRRP